MKRLRFTVLGPPKGKARPRAVASLIWTAGEPRAIVRMVTPKDTRVDEAWVRKAFKEKFPDHAPWTGPVLLRFTAVFETPKSFNRALQAAAAAGELFALRKPDKDNIEKLVVDALNGIAFADDQQVMGGGMKRYGSPARIDVDLQLLDQPIGATTPGEKRTQARLLAPPTLHPKKALPATPTKSGSERVSKPPPDLSSHSPRARALIEAAMAREEAAREKHRR